MKTLPGEYTYISEGTTQSCGLYLIGSTNQNIEIEFTEFNIECEESGLLAVSQGISSNIHRSGIINLIKLLIQLGLLNELINFMAPCVIIRHICGSEVTVFVANRASVGMLMYSIIIIMKQNKQLSDNVSY